MGQKYGAGYSFYIQEIYIKSIKAILLTFLLGVAQFSWAHHHSSPSAAVAGSFGTLLAAAEALGLVDAFKGTDNLTVFAPTDDAFSAWPKGAVETLLEPKNQARLADLPKYHIVAGKVGSDKLQDGLPIDRLSGQIVKVSAGEQGFTIQGAKIVNADIGARNGVIHVIDRVIMPAVMNAQASISLRERAITQGAPLFNDGNLEATVALYLLTAESLLDDAALDKDNTVRLRKALRQTKRSHDARANASVLRYALDDVRASFMGEMRMTMTTY